MPLERRHAADLFAAGRDDATWVYMPRPALRSVEDAESMIRQANVDATLEEIAFAILRRPRGGRSGRRDSRHSTRNRALEIGWTWIGEPWRRTAINTECKLLLLGHAFDVHGANRVTLKTDARNVRSQRAIERIGGVREGVLRRHRLRWDGSVRDSVYYGIVDAECCWKEAVTDDARALEERPPGGQILEHALHQHSDLRARQLRSRSGRFDPVEARSRQDGRRAGKRDEAVRRPRALQRAHVARGDVEVASRQREHSRPIDSGGR